MNTATITVTKSKAKRMNVHDLFSEVAARLEGEVAIERVGRLVTYGELEKRSNKVANRLLGAGAEAGTLVGIVGQDPVEVITGILGVLKAGCVFVPLDPGFPVKWLQGMVEQVKLEWYLVESKYAGKLEELGVKESGQVWELDGEEIAQEETSRPEVQRDGDEGCSIYFTSGSTGKPKAILGRLKGIDHFARWEAEVLGVGEGTRVSQLASCSFDGYLKDAFVPLCAGGVVCAPEKRDIVLEASRLIDWIDVEGVEVLHCVPSVLRAMLNEKLEARYFAGLRWVVLAGEALLPADVKRWKEVFGERIGLVNLYGPTETTVTKLHYFVQPGDEERPTIPIGKPMPGVAAMVLTPTRGICRQESVGEIYLRTPYRSLGYYGEPELTAESFIPNPFSNDPRDLIYRTGDYGRVSEDGNLEFLGRRDQQVKIRGVRVELGEIENVLRGHAGVKDVAVVDREDSQGNKYLCAYVVMDEFGTESLRTHLAGVLPESMAPSAFVEMKELPRTLNGKIDRKALPLLEEARVGQTKRPPGTRMEQLVAAIWSEVLKLPEIGIDENFFALGGHSLLATQVISRIKRTMEVDLPLRALFEAPTISEFARKVQEAKFDANEPVRLISPQSRSRELPLSFGQERLWILDQINPESSAYNIVLGMKLQGKLNIAALEQAIGEIIRRHEVLRTHFPVRAGQPMVAIEPAQEYQIPVVDLSNLADEERDAEGMRLVGESSNLPFSLDEGPLVRNALLHLGDTEYAAIAVMHHIVSDGWSRGVLGHELSVLYNAFFQAEQSPLPELTIQYADYAVWQKQWLAESLESEMSYWKRRLADAPPLLAFPTDRPRPGVQSYRGARQLFKLSPGLSGGLGNLARRSGATLFITLLAAFKAMLCRYTAQEDIVVGTSMAERNHPETEDLIGFFVNMLALRTDCSGAPEFSVLLGRVRETALEAFTHQGLPFEKLLENLPRNLSYSPLFQVVFSMQNAPVSDLALAGIRVSFPEVETTAAKYDLLLDIWETEHGLAGALEYSTDLFDASTAERIVNHYRNLLEAVVANPEQRVSSLAMLSEAEMQQALTVPTSCEYPRDACIHELFEAQVKKSPKLPAVVFKNQELSYRDLNRRANQIARCLRAMGTGPGVLVAVFMEHSADEVAALLGVLKSGAAYVPLDPTHPQRRIKSTLLNAKSPVVVTQKTLAGKLPAGPWKVLRVDAKLKAITRQRPTNLKKVATPQDIAYVIYTSGSTGEPKGVAISHQALVNYVWWAKDVYVKNKALSFPLYSSLAFDLTVTSIYTPLVTGNKVMVHPPREHGVPFTEIVNSREATVLKLTPSHLLLMETESVEGVSIRKLIVGGEALTRTMAQRTLAKLGAHVEIYNEYGPTEATVGCAIHKFDPDRDQRAFVPIGKPAANVHLLVLDKWLNPVPENVIGELHIAGDGLATGYWNRPNLTAEKFLPSLSAPGQRMYKTGDLARWLPGGILDFLGRNDNQVKLHGVRVELGELEGILSAHSDVREVAVLLREDVPGDKRIVAYLSAADEHTLEMVEIRRYMQERVPAYLLPAAFIEMKTFPLTGNGKIDRIALPAPDGSRPQLREPYVAPQTIAEQAVTSIWQQVLQLDQVGARDNFFQLGGQSILAIQIIQRINQLFAINLPMRVIFTESSVAALAVLVEETLIEKLESEPEEPFRMAPGA